MAPEPEANADLAKEQKDSLTDFLTSKDRNKFIEDWLVEDHGIQKWKAKGMVKLIIAPLTNLAGDVAVRGLQKIHQALRKHSNLYDKASTHFSKLLLVKIKCEKTKTRYSDQYLNPPAGEDPENWKKLNEQAQVWVKQLETLDCIALSLGDLKANVQLLLYEPRLKKDSAPSRWLRPYNAFIPLTGRDRETDQLKDWRDAKEVFSWKIIIGEGGIGKTRLTQEFARSCIESGWDSGFLDYESIDNLVDHDNFSNSWAPLVDTLIIVDYAATKQESLKKFLRQCAWIANKEKEQEDSAKLRLLLLERHADEDQGWVKTLLGAGEGALQDDITDALNPVMELKPPQENNYDATMAGILQSTVNRWADLTGGTAPELSKFTEADFKQLQIHTEGRPLYLQMAALHACEIGSTKELARWNRATLLNDAVKREREYIGKHCSPSFLQKLVEQMASLLYIAGKIPVNHPSLLKIIEEEANACGYPQTQPAEIIETLRQLLQEDNAEEGATLNPIQPDLIGAAFSATVLQEQSKPTETLTRAILLGGETAWANLLRSAQDLHGVGTFELETWLTPLLDGRSQEELWNVANLLPEQTVALRFFAVHLYEALLSQSTNEVEEATILNNLGIRFSELGRREEALDAALRAVEIRERLAQNNPDAYEPGLATSLNNLGKFYSELGRHKDVLGPDLKTMQIFERQSKKYPEVFEPHLATSLSNLGQCYSKLGKREDAREAALKAIKIQKRLAQKNPDGFEPDLAISLYNLGDRYSALGEHEDARDSTLKAIEIQKRLAQKNPDAFEPDLARSLSVLGNIHLQNDSSEQASEVLARGIQTLIRLFQNSPQAFAGLMKKLATVYLKSCEDTGKQPDMELLKPITQKLMELDKE